MNNLIINPQFIMIPTNTPQELHRIGSTRDKGDHCIEDQKRERESHLATTMDP